MKYFIRLLAAIPMMCVEISALILFVGAFEELWLILPCIGCHLGFVILAGCYEHTVKELIELISILCKNTPVYDR